MVAAGTHRLVGDGPPKNESAHEETRVDHCTALATSPVAAQVVTRKTTGISTGTTTGTSTSVICVEEMVATFCNVPTAPNTSGYGSSSATGSSGGAGSNTSSIPTCPDFPPANELCN